MSVFNINQLFKQTQGTDRGAAFVLPEVADSAGQFVETQRSIRARDLLGRDLFLPIRIGGLLLDNEPTIRVSGRKIIVRTRPVGSTRKGSVKETISTDDESILIRGIIVNNDSVTDYPEDKVIALKELIDRNESLEIQCGLTQILGIYRLVIEDWDFEEIRGFQHAQAYQLRCVADTDFDIVIP